MAKPTKPETLSCLIFSNVFLGDGGQDPDKTSQNFQKWTAFLKGDHDVPISSVTSHNFEADIFWYEQSASYSECDLCDVRGQIALSSSDGGPRFKIRPFSGMINKYTHNLTTGDVPSLAPSLVCLGRAGSSHKPDIPGPSSLRSFDLRISVYDGSVDNRQAEFTVRCFFNDDNRWRAWNVPRKDSLLQISGKLVGKYDDDDRGNPAILISDLVYVNASRRTEEIDQSSDPSVTGESTPVTPQKRKMMDLLRPVGKQGNGTTNLSSDKPPVQTADPTGPSSSTAIGERTMSDNVELAVKRADKGKGRSVPEQVIAESSTIPPPKMDEDLVLAQLGLPSQSIEEPVIDDARAALENTEDDEFDRVDGMDEGMSEGSDDTFS